MPTNSDDSGKRSGMPTWLLFVLVFIIGFVVMAAVVVSVGIIINGIAGTFETAGGDASALSAVAESKARLAASAADLPPGGTNGLRTGQCIDDAELDQRMAGDPYTVISCGDPHDYEVYFVHLFPEGPYPGEEAMSVQVDDICNSDEFWDYVGFDYDYDAAPLHIINIYALESSWSAGHRFGECLLMDPESTKLVGSMRGGSGKEFGWPSTGRSP